MAQIMNMETNLYKNFKSYDYFKSKTIGNSQKKQSSPQKLNIKPLIGATIGTGAALLVAPKLKIAKNKTINEVTEMLLMAGGANVGGVLAGSIGADDKQKKKKWKEAGFQMMNIAIPMLMVSGATEICNRVKALNKTVPKIIASIAAMTSGAMVATAITNATREKGEPYRKYTAKDAVSNFDDIVATIKIGFEKVLDYVPVDKILPFIYIFTGTRAGGKE